MKDSIYESMPKIEKAKNFLDVLVRNTQSSQRMSF